MNTLLFKTRAGGGGRSETQVLAGSQPIFFGFSSSPKGRSPPMGPPALKRSPPPNLRPNLHPPHHLPSSPVPQVRVIRDGHPTTIDIAELVVGDVVSLHAGDVCFRPSAAGSRGGRRDMLLRWGAQRLPSSRETMRTLRGKWKTSKYPQKCVNVKTEIDSILPGHQ